MATFNHIGGAEPSTLTFKLATVSQTRNSSVMHQEIMALGDPDTSNAIAAVLNTVPASTAWALAVRQVGNSSIQGNSTVFQGTSPWVIAGNSTVAPLAGSTWATRPIQSSAADLQMTATQGTSPWVISGNSTVFQGSSAWQAQVTNQVRVTNSSAADFVVTVSGQSTTFNVSSLAGAVIVRSSKADALMTVYQSTAADLQATVTQASTVWAVQLSNYSTQVNVSSVAGVVTVTPNSTAWVKSAGFSVDSSNYLNVNASFTGSTTVNVSSVSGVVSVMPNSTLWASSAGFHFDSSGALQINGTFSASTTVNVSSLAGIVTVKASTGANSTDFISVRVTDGVNFQDPVPEYLANSSFALSTVVGGPFFLRASAAIPTASTADNLWQVPWATLNGAQYAALVTDSGATVMDSTNTAIKVNVVAGAAGGSTQVSIKEMLTSSGASLLDSTNTAMRVNVVAGAAGGSTIVTISTVQGVVAVVPGSSLASAAFSMRVSDGSTFLTLAVDYTHDAALTFSSVTGAMLLARGSSALPTAVSADNDAVAVWASLNGAINVIQRDSTGGPAMSTAIPSSASAALPVRIVVDAITSFASTSALASTSVEVVSSGAGLRTYVTAYSITSTNQTPAQWGFFSSNATLLWPMTLAALSSGVAGANLAVAAPGYLFRTAAADALNFKTAGSTVATVQMGVSYYRAP